MACLIITCNVCNYEILNSNVDSCPICGSKNITKEFDEYFDEENGDEEE